MPIITGPPLSLLRVTCEQCGCRMVLAASHTHGEAVHLICHRCEERLIVDWDSWVDRR